MDALLALACCWCHMRRTEGRCLLQGPPLSPQSDASKLTDIRQDLESFKCYLLNEQPVV